MKNIMKNIKIAMILCFLIVIYNDRFKWDIQAKEKELAITLDTSNFSSKESLLDHNRNTFSISEKKGEIIISSKEKISFIYIEFDKIPEPFSVVEMGSGAKQRVGEEGFLHQCIDVESEFGRRTSSIQLIFEENTAIADIYVFSGDRLPDWVQVWEPAYEQADMLLVATHADDEHLFFAGILPLYAGEKKLKVQVAYTVQHFEANGVYNHQRPHEQLDGLWEVGIRNYPIISSFPDLYAESKDEETAFQNAVSAYQSVGITYEDILQYMIMIIRRCKPSVVVSHDLKGEYGHGAHVMTARALTEAVKKAALENENEESFIRYGAWQADKLYLHLYKENEIRLNLDVPLAYFDGKTAFQVSQEGFSHHKSQHWTWFYKWIYGTTEKPITKAEEIGSYSPCRYGLYFSNVGPDIKKDDFFENVERYSAKKRREYRRMEVVRPEMYKIKDR